MDDTTRSGTDPPVSQFPMRHVGEPRRDIFDVLEEQRTETTVFPVVRQRGDVQPSRGVTSLLARRLAETTFTDMVMWVDCDLGQTMVGIVVMFTPRGTFVPYLLELIEGVEIDGRRYHRLPGDGSWGSDEDGRHNVHIVVEMSAKAHLLPLMTRDVRFMFRDAP